MTVPARVLLLSALALAACMDGPEPPTPSAENGWRTAASTDSAGTIRSAFLARDAEGEALDGQTFPPSLLLRCDDGLTAVYIGWRTDLGRDTVAVTYALGDGPEHTEWWLTSSDRQAAGQWSDSLAVPFIHRLTEHAVLHATVESVEGPIASVFPLDGLADAIVPLRTACAW